MRGRSAGRRGVAAALIILTTAGLTVALIIAGLGTAAEITSFVFLMPPAVSLVRWAREDAAGRVPRYGNTLANPPKFVDQANESPAKQHSLPHIPAITFAAPIPWGSLWSVSAAGVAAVTGAWTLTYPGKPTKLVGAVFLILGVIALIAIVSGDFGPEERAAFDARPKLVVSREGIYYRWNSRRDIACSWASIVRITRGGPDGNIDGTPWTGSHLILVLGAANQPESYRPIVLCHLYDGGFPRDEIRAAIASFAPSIIDDL